MEQCTLFKLEPLAIVIREPTFWEHRVSREIFQWEQSSGLDRWVVFMSVGEHDSLEQGQLWGFIAIYRVRQKSVYTLQRKKTLRCIIDYCKSTEYFRQHNNMIYVFTSIYIVILAICFDSYESSSGINIQELLIHIVLQFFMS